MNRSERKRKAKAHVYATKGMGPNPYDPDTMEYKHWNRIHNHYWNMETAFDDLAEAYGEFRPDQMG